MITFLIKNWKDEEKLAYRISDILVGANRPSKTFKKENGHWVLGANNWFLEINHKEGAAKLNYRYTKTAAEWEALRVVIEMVL
jgi:hypothetical protein